MTMEQYDFVGRSIVIDIIDFKTNLCCEYYYKNSSM